MSTLTIDTWVSLAALLGVVVSLGGLVLGQTRSLRADVKGDIARVETSIADLRTELKTDIADLRTELRTDIGRLDDRVYALAAGLRPQVEQSQSPHQGQ